MQATMERGQTKRGFLFGIGLLAAVFVFSRVARNNASQSMSMGGGPARVRATLMQAKTVNLRADIAKAPGDNILVEIAWSQDTEDFQGNPIAWPFFLSVSLNPAPNGSPVVKVCDTGANCNVTSRSPGSRINQVILSTIGLTSRRYFVNVVLIAADTDADGQPTTSRLISGNKNAVDEIVIASPTGPAVPSGNVGAITLSQRVFPSGHMGQR